MKSTCSSLLTCYEAKVEAYMTREDQNMYYIKPIHKYS